jgi:H+/Cl- antiporter ClcA
VVIGIVLFALASRRAGGVVRSAAAVSLISLGVAFGQLFVMDVLPSLVPHPPTWLLLGFAAYGVAVLRVESPPRAATEHPGLIDEAARA